MTRREFIAGSAAFAAAPRAVADGADAPLMRLGMISDTHLVVTDGGSGVQNSLCFEPALRYFDSRKADGIVVCGDLTDFGTSSCLRHFASIWNSVFPGNKRSDGGDVVPLIILGDHDMGRYMHTKSWAPQSEDPSNIIPDHVADLWQECFGETWAPILVKECCGYKFVLAHHPEHNDESDHGNQIPGLAEFLAQQTFDASKPFFLMQHRIFKDTVLVPGCGWENGTTTEILKNYPNAIGLCGHGHCNAVDELCLWQNEFTAIQIPSLNF